MAAVLWTLSLVFLACFNLYSCATVRTIRQYLKNITPKEEICFDLVNGEGDQWYNVASQQATGIGIFAKLAAREENSGYHGLISEMVVETKSASVHAYTVTGNKNKKLLRWDYTDNPNDNSTILIVNVVHRKRIVLNVAEIIQVNIFFNLGGLDFGIIEHNKDIADLDGVMGAKYDIVNLNVLPKATQGGRGQLVLADGSSVVTEKFQGCRSVPVGDSFFNIADYKMASSPI